MSGPLHPPFVPELDASHVAYVERLLRRFRVSEAERDDVRQDVLLSLHRSLTSYEARASFETWIFAIVSRAAQRHKRRLVVWEQLDELLVGTDDLTPEDTVVESERLLALKTLLGALDHDKRQILEDRILRGWSVPEIARRRQLPVQTAYTRLKAARVALSGALAALGLFDGLEGYD